MCCLYFDNSRERFAFLKSQRMIKTESGYFYSVSGVRVIYIKYIFIRETGQFSSK